MLGGAMTHRLWIYSLNQTTLVCVCVSSRNATILDYVQNALLYFVCKGFAHAHLLPVSMLWLVRYFFGRELRFAASVAYATQYAMSISFLQVPANRRFFIQKRRCRCYYWIGWVMDALDSPLVQFCFKHSRHLLDHHTDWETKNSVSWTVYRSRMTKEKDASILHNLFHSACIKQVIIPLVHYRVKNVMLSQ